MQDTYRQNNSFPKVLPSSLIKYDLSIINANDKNVYRLCSQALQNALWKVRYFDNDVVTSYLLNK